MIRKFISFAVFIALLAGLAIRFLPLRILKKSPVPVPVFLAEYLRPGLLPVKTLAVRLPKPKILEQPTPLWQADTTRQKQMILAHRFGSTKALKAKVKLNHLNYLAAGDTFIATVDVYDKQMLIFSPRLNFIRRWPLVTRYARIIKVPMALAARKDEVAVLAEDGTLALWRVDGQLQSDFKIQGTGTDLAFLPGGNLL
ncbi:MAG: hypothetical protein D6814_01610, partial [Calditrichaeota bacterium]